MDPHRPLPEYSQSEKRLRLSFVLTLFMFLIQFVGGIITNSLAIASDALHLLSDVLALLLSWYAVKQMMRPADERNTFGYHRYGSLAAFINGLTLIGISFYIAYQAVWRIVHPSSIHVQGMMWLATAGCLFTLSIVLILKKGDQNINIQSTLLHFIGDVLSYLAILVGGSVIALTGWVIIDPLLSALFALVILRNAWLITKEAGAILLESVPQTLSVASIRQRLLQEPEIQQVLDLHVWSLSSEFVSLSTHLQVISLPAEALEAFYQRIEKILAEEFGIVHTTIQLKTEPKEKRPPLVNQEFYARQEQGK